MDTIQITRKSDGKTFPKNFSREEFQSFLNKNFDGDIDKFKEGFSFRIYRSSQEKTEPKNAFKQEPYQQRREKYGKVADWFPYTSNSVDLNPESTPILSGVKDVFSLPVRGLLGGISSLTNGENTMGRTAEESRSNGFTGPLESMARDPFLAPLAVSGGKIGNEVLNLTRSFPLVKRIGANTLALGTEGAATGSLLNLASQEGYEDSPLAASIVGAAFGVSVPTVFSIIPEARNLYSVIRDKLRRNKLETSTMEQLQTLVNRAFRGGGSKPLNTYETAQIISENPEVIDELAKNATSPNQLKALEDSYDAKLRSYGYLNVEANPEDLKIGSATIGKTNYVNPNQMSNRVSDKEKELIPYLKEAKENYDKAGLNLEKANNDFSSAKNRVYNAKKELEDVVAQESTPKVYKEEPLFNVYSYEAVPSYYEKTYTGNYVDPAKRALSDAEEGLNLARSNKNSAEAALNEASGNLSNVGNDMSLARSERNQNYSKGMPQFETSPISYSPRTETNTVSKEFQSNLQNNLDEASTRMVADWYTVGGRLRRNYKGEVYDISPENLGKRAKRYANIFENMIAARARGKSKNWEGFRDPSVYNDDVVNVLREMAGHNEYEFMDAILNSCNWLSSAQKSQMKNAALMEKYSRNLRESFTKPVDNSYEELPTTAVKDLVLNLPGIKQISTLGKLSKAVDQKGIDPNLYKNMQKLQELNLRRSKVKSMQINPEDYFSIPYGISALNLSRDTGK